jgi:transposase-like protein
VARLLPPESVAPEVVAREVGVGAGTLERWRDEVQPRLVRGRAWRLGQARPWPGARTPTIRPPAPKGPR